MSSPCSPTSRPAASPGAAAPTGSPGPTAPSGSTANGGGEPPKRKAVRDYFQVEDEEGARFWLYRSGDGVDHRTGDLSWYLHGVFG